MVVPTFPTEYTHAKQTARTTAHPGSSAALVVSPPGEMHQMNRSEPARTVLAVATAQAAAGVGFYAVVAHLVLHLRHDLGLLASTVGIVLSLRTAVQYALYLPAGALADRLGAARAGALACAVRAAGFGLLASARNVPTLALAAVLIGVGGSVYTPAGQAILAALPGAWPRRGFAWYVATGQVSAVAGPWFGLALLDGTFPWGGGGVGFAGIAWSAAALWLAAGVLLGLVPRRPAGRQPRRTRPGWQVAWRDRALIRLALTVSPVTLLVTQTAVVVPLIVSRSRLVTAFLAGMAAMAALAQLPRWREPAIRHGVVVGFAGLGIGYAAMLPAALGVTGWPATSALLLGGAVAGVAQGLSQPAVFHRISALAPAGAAGTYFGLVSFMTGVVGFAGGLGIGYAFAAGPGAGAGAIAGLCLCAAVAGTTAARAQPPGDLLRRKGLEVVEDHETGTGTQRGDRVPEPR